jgi:DNA polymerase-3 subunit gamma/tau
VTTLYRQYRPAIFSEVTGQKHVTDTLQAAIVKNRLTHAYLFYGPRGTGKTTTARILAKRLNCEKATGAEPCGQCESCQAMVAGRNIDVMEIDAASNRGIDDIRALRERIASAPSMGK